MEKGTSTILEGLNSEQKAAVSCVDGPVLIVAGAGSGKTRVLTSRIAYILEQGCDPAQILALTFTKKAASEMKERIALMVGEKKARRLCMGTFHSVFIRFLREFSESLGYPSAFTIYDTSDSVSAIKACLKEMQLDEKVYKPKDVLSRISMAKNNLVTPAAYRRNANALQADVIAKRPRLVDVYEKYAEKCKQSGVMDFDDILLNMNILFRDNPTALEAIASRFRYIMVDEYQDTNVSQYLILKKLSAVHGNICVVGDDSQSIYAFRGARIENILNFKKDYPQHHIFRLEQNYRSTQVIVNAANSVIEKNSARIPKECYSRGEEGEKVKLIKAYDEKNEAESVVGSIKRRIYSDCAEYQDFAILYRTINQSRNFEQALRDKNIPYKVISGKPFLERAEVKDALAYMKLCVNPTDNEAFRRSFLLLPGVGPTTLDALAEVSARLTLSFWDTLSRDDLEAQGIKPAALKKLYAFKESLSSLVSRASSEECVTVARDIVLKFDLLAKYKSQLDAESQSRASNVEELLDWMAVLSEEIKYNRIEELYLTGEYEEGVEISLSDAPPVTLGDFLENAALLSASDSDDDGNKVSLMTVHASKGLEYPHVYVVGVEENIFPTGGWLANETEVEEERRLFYVAMTRAKKTLEISFASTRFRNGKHESNAPSRFVREIKDAYVLNPLIDDDGVAGSADGGQSRGWKSSVPSSKFGNTYGRSSQPVVQPRRPSAPAQPVSSRPVLHTGGVSSPRPLPRTQSSRPRTPDQDFQPTPILQLRAGQRIEHNRFGYGKILEITGAVTDLKAKILFDDHGEKILILKYAKIRAV